MARKIDRIKGIKREIQHHYLIDYLIFYYYIKYQHSSQDNEDHVILYQHSSQDNEDHVIFS